MSHEFLYEVGDEFDGSPSQASKFIKQVYAYGGTVAIDGRTVRIVSLPGKKPVVEEPVVEEPVAEEPVAEEPVVEEPVVEEPVAEEPVTDEPASKRRRRRKAVVEESESVEESEYVEETKSVWNSN